MFHITQSILYYQQIYVDCQRRWVHVNPFSLPLSDGTTIMSKEDVSSSIGAAVNQTATTSRHWKSVRGHVLSVGGRKDSKNMGPVSIWKLFLNCKDSNYKEGRETFIIRILVLVKRDIYIEMALCFHIYYLQGPLLLTWIYFNPSMDMLSHPLSNVGWNYLSIPKVQRCNRWSLGMDK